MKMTYKTRQQAQDAVDTLDSQIYHLAHGEYERPTYKARKVRGEDFYYIHATYFFYAGTFYAKQDGAMTVEELSN